MARGSKRRWQVPAHVGDNAHKHPSANDEERKASAALIVTSIAGCERRHGSRWLRQLRRMTTYGSTERQRAFLEAEIGSGSRSRWGIHGCGGGLHAGSARPRSHRSWPVMTRRGEKNLIYYTRDFPN
jgi:hypothetical protein